MVRTAQPYWRQLAGIRFNRRVDYALGLLDVNSVEPSMSVLFVKEQAIGHDYEAL